MRFIPFIFLWISMVTSAQMPSYYQNINFTLPKEELKTSLSTLITNTHNQKLSYTPGVWNALKVLDINPDNSSKVLLIYGYNDDDDILMNDRTRGKDLTCHQTTCTGRWNREHVYPKSIGEFDEDGYAYTDVHALRASDTQMNSLRYNSPFVNGDGNAHEVSNYRFFPGEEWKGDVARMILYMYLRYPNFCKPNYVGIDSHTYSNEVPDMILEWNAQDPVSEFEKRRNELIYSEYQGNRNPFIDNPYIATMLWGGPEAEDLWQTLSTNEMALSQFKLYPNPAKSTVFYAKDAFTSIKIYDSVGRLVGVDDDLRDNKTDLPLHKGLYRIEFCKAGACKTYQVLKK